MSEQMDQARPGRGGRRRKPADELRSVLIGYRGTLAEHAEVRAAAGLCGLSVSAFMRSAKDSALRGTALRPVTPSTDPATVAQLRRLGNVVNQAVRLAHYGTFPPEVGAEATAALKEISSYLRLLHYGPEH